jgi:hypothetical protein
MAKIISTKATEVTHTIELTDRELIALHSMCEGYAIRVMTKQRTQTEDALRVFIAQCVVDDANASPSSCKGDYRDLAKR